MMRIHHALAGVLAFLQFMNVAAKIDVPKLDQVLYRVALREHPKREGAPTLDGHKLVMVATADGTKYDCEIPREELYNTNAADEEIRLLPFKKFLNLLKGASERCFIYHAGWWTYEYCHESHVRQYHNNEDGTTDEFSLGLFDAAFSEAKYNEAIQKDAMMPHLSLQYRGGTPCDVDPSLIRSTEVQFICSGDTSGTFATVVEKSTCVYEIKLHIDGICDHPAIDKRKRVQEQIISCMQLVDHNTYGTYLKTGKMASKDPKIYSIAKNPKAKKPSMLQVDLINGQLKVVDSQFPEHSEKIGKSALLFVTGPMTEAMRAEVRESLERAGELEGISVEFLHSNVEGFSTKNEVVDIVLVDVKEEQSEVDCLAKLYDHLTIKWGSDEKKIPQTEDNDREAHIQHDEV
eukprot:CFRG1979T1